MKKKRSAIDKFIALPDSEKERIYQEIEAEDPWDRIKRARPLNAKERAQWRRFQRKARRPMICKRISVTIEDGLLKRADAYAKRHGMSRAKLVTIGLQNMLGPRRVSFLPSLFKKCERFRQSHCLSAPLVWALAIPAYRQVDGRRVFDQTQ